MRCPTHVEPPVYPRAKAGQGNPSIALNFWIVFSRACLTCQLSPYVRRIFPPKMEL